jgi:hypothetical protein
MRRGFFLTFILSTSSCLRNHCATGFSFYARSQADFVSGIQVSRLNTAKVRAIARINSLFGLAEHGILHWLDILQGRFTPDYIGDEANFLKYYATTLEN